jgi:hypothetical protein
MGTYRGDINIGKGVKQMNAKWYWEVIWRGADGKYYQMVSEKCFDLESQAQANLEACERAIGEFLHNQKATLIDSAVVLENKRET